MMSYQMIMMSSKIIPYFAEFCGCRIFIDDVIIGVNDVIIYRLVKVWDYQNKACVQTLEGHAQNVTAVAFHSELPILMTGSEDGTECLFGAIPVSFAPHPLPLPQERSVCGTPTPTDWRPP